MSEIQIETSLKHIKYNSKTCQCKWLIWFMPNKSNSLFKGLKYQKFHKWYFPNRFQWFVMIPNFLYQVFIAAGDFEVDQTFFGKISSESSFNLTLSTLIPDEDKKFFLNFYFHASLWCLKRFYESLLLWGTTKKCGNKSLS